jgi:hypothetical protein
VRVAASLDEYKSLNRKKFKSDFSAAFGEHLLKKCCDNSALDIARFARHALSHAGGRLTQELASTSHGFVVCDGRIHITPKDTKALFSLLKDAAYPRRKGRHFVSIRLSVKDMIKGHYRG